MKDLVLDDTHKQKFREVNIEENKHDTIRVNGKAEREMLKEYKEKYGEERYRALKNKLAEAKMKEITSQK